MADLTPKQFAAALEKYGMRDNDGPLGYVAVNETLRVCKLNAGPSRRAQLAYLLKARDRDAERRARCAALAEKLRGLIGDRQAGDCYVPDYHGHDLYEIKVGSLSTEQAARVILLLREIRAEKKP